MPNQKLPHPAGLDLRGLRAWHWSQVMRARRRQRDKRASPHTYADAEADAAFHLKAVQLLNEFFPPGDVPIYGR